jgi:hypothetical protein
MPGDQREDDALSVCFDTAPVAEGMDLLGAAELQLRLTSDHPRVHLIARMCDLAPDGSSLRIAHGMLNLCHRDSHEEPSDVPVGRPFDVTLKLDQMAHRLAPGHRLRLALSTTYWPFLWPVGEVAALTLSGGTLVLPRHTGGASCSFDAPVSAAPALRTVLDPGRSARRITRDLITGEVTLSIESDSGMIRTESHGLVTRERVTEQWKIHPDDPGSALGEIFWQQHLSRGDWTARTEAACTMTATADTFRMIGALTAWDGENQVFHRNWDEKVPRVWA